MRCKPEARATAKIGTGALGGGLLTAALVMAGPAQASVAEDLTAALTEGTTSMNARYRYEFVDQDNDLDNANASTLRVRLGYRTGEFQGFDAFMEAEHVTAIGNENYNSFANANRDRSVVADPTATEVNQAYLRYRGLADTDIRYGRQRLALDNHRFIGTVGWRQNEQTYDAFTVVNTSLYETTLTAGYIYNVNRVFSDDTIDQVGNFRMSSPIFNARYDGLDVGSLTAYGYLLDFDDLPDNSTQTYGLRFSGSTPVNDDIRALYTLEYAYQTDYADNDASFDVSYWLAEAGVAVSGFTIKLGQERLETYRGRAFQTPLATLHAMNGWADLFLVTPDDGLQDTYVSVGTSVEGVNLLAVYHDYKSDENSIDYGSEFGLQAVYPVNANYTLGIKGTSYSADDFGVDTDKVWLWAQFSF